MARISIYYNTLASHAKSHNLHEELQKQLFRHDVSIKTFPDIKSLKDSLENEIKNNTQYIFAIGGDGTANTMLSALAGSKVKLFIIPAGTANDLAGELGIKRSLSQIIKIFQSKSTSTIDLIDINGELMATNGGIGIPTKIATLVNKYRKEIFGFKLLMRLFKRHIYTMFLLKELIFSKIKTYKLLIKSKNFDEQESIKSPMVLINNQEILAGTFPVAPSTNNCDGTFNVTIFKHQNRIKLIKAILLIKFGKYPQNDPNLISFETDNIQISVLEPNMASFFGDGEILERNNFFEIKLSDKKIDLFCSTPIQTTDRSYGLNAIESL